MSIFLAKSGRKSKYYVLKANVWDKEARAQRQKYLAYIGTKPQISLEKAKQIAHKLGISLDDLRTVRRLRIVEDEKLKLKRA